MNYLIKVYNELDLNDWQTIKQLSVKCQLRPAIVCYRLTLLTKRGMIERKIEKKVSVYRKKPLTNLPTHAIL